MRHYTRIREDEYWQVERRTEKTVWLRSIHFGIHDAYIYHGFVREPNGV